MAFASKAQQRLALSKGEGASTLRSSEVTLKTMGGKKNGSAPLVGVIPSGGDGGRVDLKNVKTPPSNGKRAKLFGVI